MMTLSAVTWALLGVCLVLGLVGGVLAWAWLVGRLTLDLGWGRSLHPLGPLEVVIDAPRALVYEVVAAPYMGRAPVELRRELEVLQRGGDLVVAAHHTRLRWLTSTTVESVRFDPPERVCFRLLRGVAPHVEEQFVLQETGRGTTFQYHGELAMDLWILGRMAGRLTARTWQGVVGGHMQQVKAIAERRAGAHRRG